MRHALSRFAVATVVLVASPALAQNAIGASDSLTARVDSVFHQYDRSSSPGCAVGIYRRGRIVYARGYGMANLELGVPITPRTPFDIASVTKGFTALAVLLLAQEGKLSLEDPISHYFPELPAYAKSITIRQMLNHIAGLRDYLSLMAFQGRSYEGVADTVDYLRIILRSAETNFPPGTRYMYSNTDYMLAGQLVERLTGQSLSAFFTDRIFGPLGMAATRLPEDHTVIIPGRAQGYAPHGKGFRIDVTQFDGGGDGGVQSTVEDFAQWDRNWETATIGGPALIDALVVPGRLRNDSVTDYALGVNVRRYRGLRVIEQWGNTEGFVSVYQRFPDQHLGVAVFCNLSSADIGCLTRAVATVYLQRVMTPDTSDAATAALLAAPVVTIPAVQLRYFEGAWSNRTLPRRLTTSVEGDSLMVKRWGTRLAPLGGNRFRLSRLEFEFVFDKDSAGTPQRLVVRDRTGGVTSLDRADAVRLTDEQLAEYAGEYRSEEIETIYDITVSHSVGEPVTARNGSLSVRVGGRMMGRLEPFSRDQFELVDFPQGTNVLFEFLRDARGRITGFAIQSERIRNLKFVRQH